MEQVGLGINVKAEGVDSIRNLAQAVQVLGGDLSDLERKANGQTAAGLGGAVAETGKESGERAVRIIVQNGESRPVIYMLKLIGNASESDELIEKININADGYIRSAETTDGVNYTASVGYRIDSISILPVTVSIFPTSGISSGDPSGFCAVSSKSNVPVLFESS